MSSFEPMDLKALTDDDLTALLETMRALALQKNRVALDLYCVIEMEMLARHQTMDIADYTTDEVSKAVACLCSAVDAGRANSISDDYPAMQFLMLTITTLVETMEQRDVVHPLQ